MDFIYNFLIFLNNLSVLSREKVSFISLVASIEKVLGFVRACV